MVVKVRFDGNVFVPEGPVSLPIGHTLEIDVSGVTETLEQRFQRLADLWTRETAFHSSTSVRVNHPAYQEIISLGLPAVPLMLRDLATTRRHWFGALRSITGADPVSSSEAGNINLMIESWQQWGHDQGWL